MRYVTLKVVYHKERVAFRRHQRGDAEWTFTVINKLLDVWTPSVVRVGRSPPWCRTTAQNWTQHLDVSLHNKTTQWDGVEWAGGGPCCPGKAFHSSCIYSRPKATDQKRTFLCYRGPEQVSKGWCREEKKKQETHGFHKERVRNGCIQRVGGWGRGRTASQQ